ncbi:lytic transglycosylase domain-containing protein [Sphingobium sp. R-21]|uniref:lytic transglycosylase domain-containing protein n=1 Tax=Sphingobium sp. R-21 TaxID=3404056 RepID=UPI003CEBA912
MRRSTLLFLSGLTCACLLPSAALAQSAAIERAMPGIPFGEFIAEAASRFALPSAWLHAIMHAESRGKLRAVSPKGAMGLMQIMPATWDYLRARHRLGPDAFDPHDNIIAGAGYIRELFDRYGSPGWIAAYNAGPGRYEAALRGRPLPAETRAYVAMVAPAIAPTGTANATAVAMVDHFAWSRSPIFVARAAPFISSSAESADQQLAKPAQFGEPSAAPQPHGLFAARATGDGLR